MCLQCCGCRFFGFGCELLRNGFHCRALSNRFDRPLFELSFRELWFRELWFRELWFRELFCPLLRRAGQRSEHRLVIPIHGRRFLRKCGSIDRDCGDRIQHFRMLSLETLHFGTLRLGLVSLDRSRLCNQRRRLDVLDRNLNFRLSFNR